MDLLSSIQVVLSTSHLNMSSIQYSVFYVQYFLIQSHICPLHMVQIIPNNSLLQTSTLQWHTLCTELSLMSRFNFVSIYRVGNCEHIYTHTLSHCLTAAILLSISSTTSVSQPVSWLDTETMKHIKFIQNGLRHQLQLWELKLNQDSFNSKHWNVLKQYTMIIQI